jgi:hypothetical protein
LARARRRDVAQAHAQELHAAAQVGAIAVDHAQRAAGADRARRDALCARSRRQERERQGRRPEE